MVCLCLPAHSKSVRYRWSPIGNHAVASISFEVIDALKLPHRAKCAFVEVEMPSVPKMYNAEQNLGFTVCVCVLPTQLYLYRSNEILK